MTPTNAWLLVVSLTLAPATAVVRADDAPSAGIRVPRNRMTHAMLVTSVVFSPDGKTLASGSSDQAIGVRDAAGGTKRTTRKGHARGVNAVAFSPDGKTLASGSDDRTVVLWDLATGKKRAVLQKHFKEVNAVAF